MFNVYRRDPKSQSPFSFSAVYDFFFGGDENIQARRVSCCPHLLLRNEGSDSFLIDSAEAFVPLVF